MGEIHYGTEIGEELFYLEELRERILVQMECEQEYIYGWLTDNDSRHESIKIYAGPIYRQYMDEVDPWEWSSRNEQILKDFYVCISRAGNSSWENLSTSLKDYLAWAVIYRRIAK